MIPIQERIAEVLRRHERTGPPFILIDLAGTGQLLASIDAMHRGASGVAAVDGSTSK